MLSAYITKSGRRATVSVAKARQFDQMAENWVRNAERSGNPNDYATAAKQALVSAFYWKHAGDSEAAKQQMDRADWAIARAKGATDKRTLKWVVSHRAPTRKLVFGRVIVRTPAMKRDRDMRIKKGCAKHWRAEGFKSKRACVLHYTKKPKR